MHVCAGMALYRLYMGSAGLPHAPAIDIECGSDLEALAAAYARLAPFGWAEVWHGTRLLGRIGHANDDASSSMVADREADAESTGRGD